MDAHILAIGDELLIGQTLDTNSHFLAKQLSQHGIEVQHIACCRDSEAEIFEHLHRFLQMPGVIITSGGLGPTRDDVTKKAIAHVLGRPLEFNEEAYRHIENFFKSRPHLLKPAHRQQAFMPAGVELLNNDVGTAHGMCFETENGGLLISLPGVPYEFVHLVETAVIPKLTGIPGHHSISSVTAKTAGVPETELEVRLANFISMLPEGMDVSFLPALGEVKIRFTFRHVEEDEKVLWLEKIQSELPGIIGSNFYGWNNETLAYSLGKVLEEKKMSLATAESCTGGYIAHKITSVPGSSNYFKGSVVAYANHLKTTILQVDQNLINRHGAVSEEVVYAMAKGVLETTEADVAMATSGIAGPGGEVPGKPVGTIWVAWGTKEEIKTRLLHLPFDRAKNIALTSTYVMNLCRKFLKAM